MDDIFGLIVIVLLIGGIGCIIGILKVHRAFHPSSMALADAPIEDRELWSWSGA